MQPFKYLRFSVLTTCCLLAQTSFAAGLLLSDNHLREDLSWLSERNVIKLNLSTWPLSQEEVERALNQAKVTDRTQERSLQRIKQQLQRKKNLVQVEAQLASGGSALPQGFAQSEYSDFRYTLSGNYSNDNLDLNLQVNAERGREVRNSSNYNLHGSYAAVNLFNQWLSFGDIAQWWGPSHEGSLIRGDAARPVTGFLLQRADQSPFAPPWLSWIGSWQYQLSVGQLKEYSMFPNTNLIGLRVTMNPNDCIELGASRVVMWGGDGRPNNWNSFWDAMLGNDNTGDKDNDPGNQLAGFDGKLKLAPLFNVPVSLYGQLIGEDEAGLMPAISAYLAGVEGHHIAFGQPLSWYLEGANTFTNWNKSGVMYQHFVYRDGYYQQGYPLGHGIGGDGRMLSFKVSYSLDDDNRRSTRLLYAKVNKHSQSENEAFAKRDSIKGIDFNWWHNMDNAVISDTKLWLAKADNSDRDEIGIAMQLTIPLT